MASEKIENIYFTDYKVSTITCNVDLGITINLLVLFNNFDISNKFIWIYYPKLDDNINKRGVNPKKIRKEKKDKVIKKNSFDNQVTILYKSLNFPNLKIFKNGNIQLTGIKNKDDVYIIIQSVIEEIKKIYIIDNAITTNDINDIGYNNFHIRMINTDFKTFINKELTEKFIIRRGVLHKILMSDLYNNKCSFEPGKYHGVKVEFFWNKSKKIQDGKCNCSSLNCFGKGSGLLNSACKKITIAIFESGSVLITGGVSFDQINDAYIFICNIFNKHKNEIRKIDLNALIV